MKINERSKFIINRLLKQNSDNCDSYVTASEIADSLKVSLKTVSRQLSSVEKIISSCGMVLERKTGSGMRLLGSDEAKAQLTQMIADSIRHDYSPDERGNIILSRLLKSQEPMKLQGLAQFLNVADTTVSNDLDRLEPWLQKANLTLVRRPGLGVYIEGLERDIRKAIINHIYEHSNEKGMLKLLYSKSTDSKQLLSDADKFLLDLVDKNIIQKVEEAVKAAMQKHDKDMSLNSFSGLVVHLTLAVQRLFKGDSITIDEQFLQQIRNKEEFATAENIGREIEALFKVKVPEAEIAYITMHLMGARNNYQKSLKAEYSDVQLIKIAKQIIVIAERESGVTVVHKSRLLVGLVKHLGPAAVRMKLKMDIRNPLLRQMKERYPQWMKIACKASSPLEKEIGVKLPEAEIAYIAMHLGSALEESASHHRQYKVLVACPTGIATSKLLASQLRRVFVNIHVAAVVSAVNVDYQLYKREKVDFIVSTVPIEDAKLPVVVVDFMLNDEDQEHIIEQMKIAAMMNTDSPQQISAAYPLTQRLHKLNAYSSCICEVLEGFFCTKCPAPADLKALYRLAAEKAASDAEQIESIQRGLSERERLGSTVVEGLMLLHAKSSAVSSIKVGLLQLDRRFQIGSSPVQSVLVMLVPAQAQAVSLETIGCISENLVDNFSMITVLHEGSEPEVKAELEKLYARYFKDKYKQITEV